MSPSEWIARRCAAHGGIAVCQPTSKQSAIAQTSGDARQSELDVVANLASDQGFDWTEWGGRLVFGTRHWAWLGGIAGQRDFAVTWSSDDGTDALDIELNIDDDDTSNVADGTVSLPYDRGVLVRPWDRLRITGVGPRSGVWLVESLTFTADGVSPIGLNVSQPRKPAKKKGSTT